MSRFLSGTTNSYKTFQTTESDGIHDLERTVATTTTVDCKIVTHRESLYTRDKAPAGYIDLIRVYLTEEPFKGSDTRPPDEIQYNGKW